MTKEYITMTSQTLQRTLNGDDQGESSRHQINNIMHALLRATPDGLLIINQEGDIIFVNATTEKLFGYTAEELLGQKMEILMPAKSVQKHVKHRQHYFEHPNVRPMGVGLALYGQHKDGHIFPVEISLSPIEAEDGVIVLATIRDITQQKHMEEKLKHLAEHDPLTGLINRTLFVDRMEQAILRSKRMNLMMAVCFLDLDDFKAINDHYGHTMGDLVLCAAADRLQHCIRDSDTLARLGGDEFALILFDIKNKHDVVNIVNKIMQHFSEGFVIEHKTMNLTWSIGISLFPRDGEETLIEKADAAMYAAKKQGKNNFKWWASLPPGSLTR